MSHTKQRAYSTSQLLYLTLSAIIILSAGLNYVFNWGLFNIAIDTFSVLSIFASSLILWLFVGIDWPSIMCIILLGLLPGLTYPEVFQLSFGNTTFVFLLFTFIVTHALEQTNYLKRISGWALNNAWAQQSPIRFIFAFFGVMLFIASFVSPTILFMIAFPLYEEIVQQFGFERGNRNASIILISLYATIAIGTAMTPINHVFAITAMGLYEAAYGMAISNSQYMSFAIPAGLAIFVLLLISMRWVWRLDLSGLQVKNVKSLDNLPRASSREKWVLAVFMGVVALWILPEFLGALLPAFANFMKSVGIAFPPMLGALALSVIAVEGKPLIKLQEAIIKGVYWPSLLIVAATLSLGSVLSNPYYGVTELIQTSLTPLLIQLSPIMMVLVFVIWAGLQTNFSSNLVTTSVVTTIVITIASAQGDNISLNVAVLASLIGFMTSLAFMTPPAMPYVAISIGSGWTSAKDAFLYGLYILTLSVIAATFIGYPLGARLLSNFM